ncbi:MAG: DUF3857 domain-containing protein [Calditrichaeota bacterium]|nr:MAG: DUF3857 domain-containing protein [Calditrichota bacterium]
MSTAAKMNRLIVAFFISLSTLSGAVRLPAWVQEAQQHVQTSYDDRVPFVVLLYQTDAEVKRNGSLYCLHRRVMKILDERALYLALHTIHYREGDKLANVNVYNVFPDGTVEKFDPADIVESTILRDAAYSDEKQALIALEHVKVGHLLAFEYSIESKPLINCVEFAFQPFPMPVVLSRFRITVPSGWRFSHIIPHHSEWVNSKVTDLTGDWSCENLPFVDDELFFPPLHLAFPLIYVRFQSPQPSHANADTWEDFSDWVRSLWTDKMTADPSISSQTAVFMASSSPAEALFRIADFVQNSIRYELILIDMGRFAPASASKTFANRYGDCKAKTALAVAMFATLGLEAYPVLVCTKENGSVYPEMPFSYFNHVVTAVRLTPELLKDDKIAKSPGQVDHLLIFDPTAGKMPIGQIPLSLQNTLGLVIEPDTSYFLHLPAHPLSLETSSRTIDVKIMSSGDVEVEYRYSAKGGRAFSDRVFWSDIEPDDRIKTFLHALEERFYSPAIDRFQIDGLGAYDDHYLLKGSFRARSYCRKSNELLMFEPNLYAAETKKIKIEENRRIDIYWGERFAHTDTIRFNLPPNYIINELPDGQTLELEALLYQTEYQLHENTLTFIRRYAREFESLSPAYCPQVNQFLAQLYESDRAQVVLKHIDRPE